MSETKTWEQAVREAVLDMLPQILEEAYQDGLMDRPVVIRFEILPDTEAEECHT